MNTGVNRRGFLRTSALSSAAVAGAAAMSSGRVHAAGAVAASPAANPRSLAPEMLLKGTAALSKPSLTCQEEDFPDPDRAVNPVDPWP